jgi:hypothetical protein
MVDNVLFWKNFSLGRELSIAGSFIYNGLNVFHELETLDNEDEIFEFLYNVSVGVERLEKIAIILIEHENIIDQESFEQSLKTHTHLELLARVKKAYTLNLQNPHNAFLQLLENFYKTMRYDRYTLPKDGPQDKEKRALKAYIEKELNVSFNEKSTLHCDVSDSRITKFIGKIIGKIALELHSVISKEATRQNIYTDELRFNSKAFKIFVRKEFDFLKETVLWKELMIFLMNTTETSGMINFMKEVEPLAFDPGLISDYLASFQSDLKKLECLDELEHLYEEDVEDKKNRFAIMDIIGSPHIYFEEDEDEIDDL